MWRLWRQWTTPQELRAYVDYWASCISRGESEFCVCVMLATEMPSIPANVAAEVVGRERDGARAAERLRRHRLTPRRAIASVHS